MGIEVSTTAPVRSPLLGSGFVDVKAGRVFWLAWNREGLVAAAWSKASLAAVLRGTAGYAVPRTAALPDLYLDVLERYFGGESIEPAALPVDLRGTPFQVSVWRELRSIPRGEVRTYAEVAARVGSPAASRAVGNANSANPLPVMVPCHRVVASGRRLGGYAGGLERKEMLLALEGVRVANGMVQARRR